jgi:electron transfer flavoprotein alpha subunit
MAKVLIIAEHDGSALNPATAKCVSCAAAIDGADIDVLVMAASAGEIAAQAAALDGVSRVLTAERPENVHAVAAVQAPQVVAVAGDYSHLVGPSTTFGRDLMPRVAALLGVNQVTDIMAVEGSPADVKLVATARVASWPAAGAGNSAQIEAVSAGADLPTHTRYIGLESAASDRPDLQTASRVVAGGRALGSEEQFGLIYELADALGAAVGASRAAVDAGYCPNELQVGQTGKIIAPELYIAIGISGAIQHMTGIKDAGTIVAINKDEEAPIFEVADIGLVADLFAVMPELKAALSS